MPSELNKITDFGNILRLSIDNTENLASPNSILEFGDARLSAGGPSLENSFDEILPK